MEKITDAALVGGGKSLEGSRSSWQFLACCFNEATENVVVFLPSNTVLAELVLTWTDWARGADFLRKFDQ